MLVVHGVGRPSKILQDRHLANLMTRRKITFKARIISKKHKKRGAHMLAPGAAGVKAKFVGKFVLLLDMISVKDKKQEIEVSPL